MWRIAGSGEKMLPAGCVRVVALADVCGLLKKQGGLFDDDAPDRVSCHLKKENEATLRRLTLTTVLIIT